MNNKALVLLGGAFLVLAVAFLLVKPSRPEVKSAAFQSGQMLVKDFKPDEARSVKLVKGDRTIQLAKKDDKWVVASKGDRPADEGRVRSLLDAVREARIKEDRTGSQETFELDAPRRLSIQISGADDKMLASIAAGKSPDYGTGFVLGDGDKVFLVDQNFADRAQVTTENDKKTLTEDKWYDLKLLRIASDDVIDVAFQKGDQKWRIQKVVEGEGPVKPKSKDAEKKDETTKAEPKKDEAKAEEKKDSEKTDEKKADDKKDETAKAEPKKDEAKAEEKKDSEKTDEKKADDKKDEKKEEKKPVWRVTEPQDAEANESECNSVASSLAWLDAKGYADELKPEEQGFDKPEATTRVVLKDGTTHTIVFGRFVKNEKNDSDSYATAKLDDKPQVWKVDKYAFDNLTKALDKLKKEAPKAEEKKDEPKAEEKKNTSVPDEKKDAEKKAEEKSEQKTDTPK